jgi:membrane-associated phospholipid phosphatase
MLPRHYIYNSFWLTIAVFILVGVTRVENWGVLCLIIMIGSLIGVRKDSDNIPWSVFMPIGCLVLSVFYAVYVYAGDFWEQVVSWQTKSIHHTINWNNWFNAIPGNDGAFARLWQPEWLTSYMKAVYSYGFTLSFWVCVIRAFFTKDVKKFIRYALAGYLLQVPLILPFYNTIMLQEVWYVQGTADPLQRGWTVLEQGKNSINCFPSMHTSIAFAALLLIQREKSIPARVLITLFCCSIIASTLYLKIHWVIDVAAGILFACMCVRISDSIVECSLFIKATASWKRFGLQLYRSITERKSNQLNQPDHDKG